MHCSKPCKWRRNLVMVGNGPESTPCRITVHESKSLSWRIATENLGESVVSLPGVDKPATWITVYESNSISCLDAVREIVTENWVRVLVCPESTNRLDPKIRRKPATWITVLSPIVFPIGKVSGLDPLHALQQLVQCSCQLILSWVERGKSLDVVLSKFLSVDRSGEWPATCITVTGRILVSPSCWDNRSHWRPAPSFRLVFTKTRCQQKSNKWNNSLTDLRFFRSCYCRKTLYMYYSNLVQ